MSKASDERVLKQKLGSRLSRSLAQETQWPLLVNIGFSGHIPSAKQIKKMSELGLEIKLTGLSARHSFATGTLTKKGFDNLTAIVRRQFIELIELPLPE